MFKIRYDNRGEIIYISSATENEKSNENELIVNELPFTKQFYQRMRVENGKLIVVDNELTEEQIKMYKQITLQQDIDVLKHKLAATDYLAIKYAKGLISSEDYEPTKNQRQTWREQINKLEIDYKDIALLK